MMAKHVLTVGLLFATVMAPVTTADPLPTYACAPLPGGSCAFVCEEGDFIMMTGTGVSMECGGVSDFGASGLGFRGRALYDDVGICRALSSSTSGVCMAKSPDVAWISVETSPVNSPQSEPTEVWTPSLQKTCLPANLVCVGPADPQHVLTVPGSDGAPLAPPAGASVTYTNPAIILPAVETSDVGPYTILTEPVPVTACDPSCEVPTGVSGGPSGTVTLTVYVGSTTISHDVTLP